jgi:sigma-B regulation protein RsbU (phosphoserine phosphatase)
VNIAAMSLPAGNVGGDYYDFIPIDENKLGLVIADVSGKGMPAAILMATTRSALRTQLAFTPSDVPHLEAAHSIPLTIARMNNSLCKDTEPHRFVTLLYGVLDNCSIIPRP